MTTGNVTYSSTDQHFLRKQWSGGDDPVNHKSENAYECTWDEIIQGPGHYCPALQYRINWPWRQCSERYATGGSIITPDLTGGLELAALSKIAEQIRGHGLDLGNYVAEGRQTLAMAIGTATKFRLSLRRLKSGDVEGAVRALGVRSQRAENLLAKSRLRRGQSSKEGLTTNHVASSWLALQYGWLPPLSDISEAGRAWEAATKDPRVWQFTASKRSPEATQTQVWGPETYYATSYASVRVRVRVTEQLSVPRSLGLLDPLGIAWEAVPFSFVADWFLPIGDYLDALSVFNGISADKLTTVKRRSVTTLTSVSNTYTDELGGFVSSPKRQLLQTQYSRGYSPTVTVPPPTTFKPLSKALSKGHLYNAVALLRSFLR